MSNLFLIFSINYEHYLRYTFIVDPEQVGGIIHILHHITASLYILHAIISAVNYYTRLRIKRLKVCY